jgi:NADH-quinone oxidoreductase subunit J
MMERILFYILAVIIVGFAIASVTSKKILRAVIYLLFALLAIAGIYFMVDYAFLAAIQMAVYAGGIIILFIFSVLLVDNIEGELEAPSTSRKLGMAAISFLGFALTIMTIYSFDFNAKAVQTETTVSEIGKGLLSYEAGGFILPFEVISVLLLAAMIGAIIIAKGTKKEA